MENPDLAAIEKKLDEFDTALAEQRMMLTELLRLARLAELSSSFSVDAINSLFASIDRVLTSAR